MGKLEQIFVDKNFSLPQNGIQCDSAVHRFKRNPSDRNENAWYCCFHQSTPEGKDFYAGALGDWKTGEKHSFCTHGKITTEIKVQIKRASEAARRQRVRIQKKMSEEATALLKSLQSPPQDFAYLQKKNLSHDYGSLFYPEENCLMISCQDVEGTLWGFQKIYVNSDKYFMKGQRTEGCFFAIDTYNWWDAKEVYLCEGFATAATLYEALDRSAAVLCCFSASNLGKVAHALKQKYPSIQINICADNDQWTHKPIKNPGVTKAKEAAQKVSAKLIIPSFNENQLEGKPTDFNDLHRLAGIQEVQNQLIQIHQQIQIHEDHEPEPSHALSSFYSECKLVTNLKGKPIPNVSNLCLIFKHAPELKDKFWFDVFHVKYYHSFYGKKQELDHDNDPKKIQVLFQSKYGFHTISESAIYSAILLSCYENTKNEPKDWMESLQWDQQPRLYEFFEKAMGVKPNEYTTQICMNWFISMVARIYEPGCKVDNMVILEGSQGQNKSEALKIIAGPWYGSSGASIQDKDFLMTLQGKMLTEIAELDSFNKADTNLIKKILTTSTDTYRPAYGRVAKDYPRQGIFVGTTNDSHYLKDSTGNRRFWPIETSGSIDLQYIQKNRNMLFAEAVYLYKKGQSWWETPEITAAIQEERREFDPWEELIDAYTFKNQIKETTMVNIFQDCLKIDISKMDHRMTKRIAKVLKSLGWVKGNRKRIEGKPVRPWYASEEIMHQANLALIENDSNASNASCRD